MKRCQCFVLSSNSRPFWRKTHGSNTARQRVVTERLRREHLPRSTLHPPIRIDSGWQTRQEREGIMLIDQHREREYDVTKPRIAMFQHIWKIHQNTVYWCNLRVAQSKGLQFYQMRSNAIILYNNLLAVSGSQEKNCTAKRINLLFNRKELYLNRTCIRDARTTASSVTRTSFYRSRKHRETCGGGTYKETCRGEIDFRIQRPSKSTSTSARKQSRTCFTSSRRIQIETR